MKDEDKTKGQLIQELDQQFRRTTRGNAQIEAAVRNYETAYRMQAAVPELVDLSGESEATKAMYGLNDSHQQKAAYGRQCLLARRLIERGGGDLGGRRCRHPFRRCVCPNTRL